ncbi:class I SAM-dependent methyltransferase [Breoghania sp. L-A4]|uniref:class I SAM-dependent methyltransferase n=1 Tax=Breoghania sp. L-A4 TaxID=2304600 RepID=UPI000E35B20D|nr:class I SAM-dependent methyltransferase [Breoghania sp. L-A4]AXS39878.1 methyltransferase domain-containing protein [Breoghania sp. L-A4]
MKTYCIKENYSCNLEPTNPMYSEESSLIYQKSVYEYVKSFIELEEPSSILDVGCGLGYKLEKYILPTGIGITGVDQAETIELCRKRNQTIHWVEDDIEQPHADLGSRFNLVISADVIEHLFDPDCLIDYIRKWAAPGAHIVLSTPERDLRRGPADMGPPANRSHVREWNEAEFKEYLTEQRLDIVDYRIVELREGISTCQLARCTVKR